MGNVCSQQKSRFDKMNQFLHPAFGLVSLMKDKQHKKQILVKKFICQNQIDLANLHHKIQQAQICQKQIPGLISFKQYQIFSEYDNLNQCCKQQNTVNAIFILPNISQQKVLSNILRIKQQQMIKQISNSEVNQNQLSVQKLQTILNPSICFRQTQIFNLLNQIIKPIYYFSSIKSGHGAIRASNILAMDFHKYLLVNAAFLRIPSNYDLLYRDKILTYTCPQHVAAFNKNLTDPTFDKNAQDIFALGLVILQMCILKPLQFAYIDYNGQLHFVIGKLMQQLQVVKKRYSFQLYSLLCEMLAIESKERISVQKISQIVNPKIEKNSQNIQIVKHENTPSKQVKKHQAQMKKNLIALSQKISKVMTNKVLMDGKIDEEILKKQEHYILKNLKYICQNSKKSALQTQNISFDTFKDSNEVSNVIKEYS